MAEAEAENKNRTNPSTPAVARRCRIPKLNRSSSVKINGEVRDSYHRSNPRPISLTLPSSKSKDFSWRYVNHGSVSSMGFNGVDDDRSSLKSFGSFISYTSIASQSQATDASLSRPGSRVRNKKYVLHCERHPGPTEEYLTPTQRKDKEIRQLKLALVRKSRLCEEKEAEIERLKSELERIHDALSEVDERNGSMQSSHESDQLENLIVKNSPSDICFHNHVANKSDSQHTVIIHANDDSGISNDISISPRHSSECEDDVDTPTHKATTSDKESSTDPTFLDSSSDSANEPCLKESTQTSDLPREMPGSLQNAVPAKSQDLAEQDNSSPRLSHELEVFLNNYQKELEQLKVQHKENYQDLKVKFDERVHELQQNLTEANSRYFELRPLFDRAQNKILTLENQLGEVQRDMETQEEWHNQMYLKMYRWKSVFKISVCASVASLAFYQLRPYLKVPHFLNEFATKNFLKTFH